MLTDKEIKKIMVEEAGNDFDDECIQPNGVDLKLKNLYYWDTSKTYGLNPDGSKMIPELKPVHWREDGVFHIVSGNCYVLDVGDIKTPKNIGGLFTLRSTFMRCGLVLESAVLDAGYCGNLRFILYPINKNMNIQVVKNERIVQMVLFNLNDPDSSYDGDYQNNKIYNNRLPKPKIKGSLKKGDEEKIREKAKKAINEAYELVESPESDGHVEYNPKTKTFTLRNCFPFMRNKK